MQLRYDTGTLSATQSIELETHETLPDHTAPIIFSIPRELARPAGRHRPADPPKWRPPSTKVRNAEHVADRYQMSNECRQSIKAVAALMGELHAADRNHVWAYYIRNMIPPRRSSPRTRSTASSATRRGSLTDRAQTSCGLNCGK